MNSFVLFQSSLIPLLLITSFLSVNLPSSVRAADTAEYTNCSQPIICGKVTSNITYPFWGANRAEYCGKSGFEVTCEGNAPLITMRNINFRILGMNDPTTTPTVTVAREDYYGTICPAKYVATNLNISLFSYSSGLLNVTFYYGCNQIVSPSNSVACNATITVSYLTATAASGIPDQVGCKAVVLIPVPQSNSAALDNGTTDIKTAIDGGFGLDVLNDDTTLCKECVASGGVCGQNSTTGAIGFKCFCQATSSSKTTCTESVSQSPTAAPSPSPSPSDFSTKEAALVIAAVGLLTMLVFYFLWKKRMAKKRANSEIIRNGSVGYGKNDTELPVLSLRSILAATDNFSEANKLGEGGFGPVYKGILPENREVAIKRLSKKSGQGQQEFINELKLIAALQHTNLVRLLGCCTEAEEMILMYEYMPNRSLDKLLFDPSENTTLNWSTRFKIIEGIAQGLLYIHKYSRLRIIHRDVKASNILLDGSMNPKISDFGMAKIFDINQTEANTNRVVGTYGYMSPEYARYGQFSEKSDVFSFGVLLLEIVSGKKNASFYRFERSLTLAGWVWDLWKEGRGTEVIDAIIIEAFQFHEALRCIHVGLLCVQESAADRPTMTSVIHMLQGNEVKSLPPTKEPAFSTRTNISAIRSSSQTSTNCSNNGLTISLPQAR